MTEATRLLVVGEEPPAPLVVRLSSVGSVDHRSPATIAERFDPLIEADAIVVTDRSARDVLADARPATPIVGYGVDADEVVAARVDDLDALPHVVRGAALNASAAAATPVSTVDDDSDDSRSRLERLHEGTAELVGASDEEAVYESVARIARDLLGYDFCYIGIAEGDEFVPAAPGHAWQERFDVEFGVLGETYRTGEPQIIDDVSDAEAADPRWTEMRSALSVPFGDRGVFQAASDEANAFDERDLELLRLLLSYAENTLARIESETELRSSRRRVTDLHEGVTELTGLRSADDVFAKTVEIAQRVLDLDRSSTLRAEGEYLHAAALSEGSKPDDVRDRMPIDDSTLAGLTLRTGESRLVQDVAADEDADPAKPEYRSGISVPMGDHGVFQAVSTERDAFDERDLELAELLATHAAETLTRIETHERLRRERDRFSALFENIPDAAVAYEYVDDEPVVRQVNPAFEE
ncbi:GAF domain-containing protein, partial [Haloparvum sedimenti]|uniref:GAF domain-containing protein n=1 Tax=Haloparvum sedimenti TaxID=1678448 RepID=UPI001C400AFB